MLREEDAFRDQTGEAHPFGLSRKFARVTSTAQQSSAADALRTDVSSEARFRRVHASLCIGIWRYLRRLGLTKTEADDAAQQVFLVVSKKLAGVCPGAERSFAYEVASRVASDVRRGAARRYEVAAGIDGVEATTATPHELLEERRRLSLLDEVLQAMSPELREVFALFEIEELPMKEIAVVLGLPPGTVASRLRRAREEFKHHAKRLRKGPP